MKLRDVLEALPPDALVPAGYVLEQLEAETGDEEGVATAVATYGSWQERIWEVPEETRLSVSDVAEAVGRSVGWVYRRTCKSATEKLPCHRVNGGGLIFIASEIRAWLTAREL